jgi:heme exporter protein D
MIPDLGKYATEVLSAYGVSIVLLLVIVWMSVSRYRRVKAALDRIEEQGRG